MFMDTYYGEEAKMEVFAQGKKFICKFTDAKWGKGTFEVTLNNGEIRGSGKMSVTDPHKAGQTKEYEALISGPMVAVNISIKGLMSGTTIKWRNGKAPQTVKLAGTYLGDNFVSVMKLTYVAKNTGYSFWVNDDGTYTIMVLGQKLEGTVMGDLTLGAYTINNLVYDKKTETFSKDYSNDGLKLKFKKGAETEYKEYLLTKATIKATFGKDGSLKVENNFTAGSMPFPLQGVFNGKLSKR